MGVRVVGALVGASFGETGVGKGTRVRETLDGAGFGEGLWGPRSVGRRSSAAVPGNGGVVGTGDGAGDGSVGANDDSGPSAGVGFARAVDDAGPLGRGIFFGRAGSAFEANPGGRLGLPKGRMADNEIVSTVAACSSLSAGMLRSSDVCATACACTRLPTLTAGHISLICIYIFRPAADRATATTTRDSKDVQPKTDRECVYQKTAARSRQPSASVPPATPHRRRSTSLDKCC